LREQLPPEHPWRARAGDAADFARVLTDALAQPERWGEVAEHARAFARAKFDFARTAEAYAKVYAAALRRG
jgi:glycosyltransferase involved in cell wall biosynthesis